MSLGPLMVDVAGLSLSDQDRDVLRHPLVGSVILFSRNYTDPAQLRALVADIHAARTPPLLVAVDHEGGRVQRFRQGFSALPPARRMGQAFDVHARSGLAMAHELGWLMAVELLAHGVDLSFAPCVDLDYGLSEIIGDRALHARGDAVAQLAGAYVRGMREAGMAATAKHFPGHGAVVSDSHLALPVDRRELRDLDAELMPYRRLIANSLPAVMVAHVLFPAVDTVPASFSRRWICDVLRGGLGFSGAVFADDLSMAGAAVMGSLLERAERALAAGCDVLPVCNDRAAVLQLLQTFKPETDPASALRLVRMRGRGSLHAQAPGFAALAADARWREAQQWLERAQAAPDFDLKNA
jgi:beta-N-acetylhexosaminidase